jgi:hypothetical protein
MSPMTATLCPKRVVESSGSGLSSDVARAPVTNSPENMSASIATGAPRGMILRDENLIVCVVFFPVCMLIISPDLMPDLDVKI